MSYTLQVNITNPSDVAFLVSNGYFLALQQSVPGAMVALQWLTTPVQGAKVTLSWSDGGYSVYFAHTPLQQGVVITQNSVAPAILGVDYDYYEGVFKANGSASDPKSIRITNHTGVNANFGVAQAGGGPSVLGVPTSIRPILAGGYAEFTPTNTVTIYWTNTSTQPGTIIGSSFGIVLSLEPGTTTIYYQNGRFYTTPPESIEVQIKEATERLEKHGLPLHRRYLLE